jgi:hypothetical protein
MQQRIRAAPLYEDDNSSDDGEANLTMSVSDEGEEDDEHGEESGSTTSGDTVYNGEASGTGYRPGSGEEEERGVEESDDESGDASGEESDDDIEQISRRLGGVTTG